MMLEASIIPKENTKLQYLHTLLRGEAPRKFETLFVQIAIKYMSHLNQVLLGLSLYFFLLKCCLNKSVKCTTELGSRTN